MAKEENVVLYAYLAQAGASGASGFKGTAVIQASNEQLKNKIRQETRSAGAEVVIVPPEEWQPPAIPSANQQDLIPVFQTVLVKVIDHMVRNNLPTPDPSSLIKGGTVMPNPVSGRILFVYRVRLPVPASG